GTNFTQPVQLTLRVNPSLATPEMRIAKLVEPGWQRLQRHLSSDQATGTVTAEIQGFSIYIVESVSSPCNATAMSSPVLRTSINLDRTVDLSWEPGPGSIPWPYARIERAVVKSGP